VRKVLIFCLFALFYWVNWWLGGYVYGFVDRVLNVLFDPDTIVGYLYVGGGCLVGAILGGSITSFCYRIRDYFDERRLAKRLAAREADAEKVQAERRRAWQQ
jgi:hypothetical protein